jgi:HEAT repeat protein
MRGLTSFVWAASLLCCSWLVAGDEPTVESLVAGVADQDPAAAVAAIDALDKIEPAPKAAVPALIQALGREDEAVRWHAARTLGDIGADAEEAVPALTKALDDSSVKVQAYAAHALGSIGKSAEPAVEKLIERAFDKDPLVRRASLRGLRLIKAPPEKTRPLFLKMLESGDLAAVLPTLQSIAEVGDDAIGPMRDVLKDEKLCYWACLVLAEMGEKAAPAVPELTEVLSHQDPDVRMRALLTLGTIGKGAAPAIPAIAKLLDSDSFEAVQFSAAFALGAINQKDEVATRALVAAARSGKPLLKAVSLWTLAHQNPENLAVVGYAAKTLAEGLASEDAELRTMAAKMLGDFGSHPEIVGPALAAALQDSDPRVIGHALDALAALGPKILPKVTDAIKNPKRRHFAAGLIYRLGPQAAPAVPAIIEALRETAANEDDLLFRRQAQVALAAVGPEAKDAVPVLIDSLASDDQEVRGTACYALGKIGAGAAEAVPALEKHLEGSDGASHTAAVWALLQIRPGDQALEAKAVPLLVKALNHELELARAEAAACLGGIASAATPEIIAKLRGLAEKDPDDRVREAAAAAAAKLEAK